MRVALERYGTVGQPLWPVVPSSLYGALLAREETDTRFLVITFDASVHGWGAVLRTSPDQPGVEVVSCFCFAADLLGGSFIEPSALPDCPAVHAGFLATQAASQLFPLADSTVLIRSDCLGGTGCDLRPAEGVVSLTSASSSEHGVAAQPPLHGPRGHAAAVPARASAVLKAEGVDCLSRETARARLASESLPALLIVVMAEANRRLDSPISLDLFATADKTLVPRFARHPKPLAPAKRADALAQTNWGWSRCSCWLMHRECAFLFSATRDLARVCGEGALGRHAWGRRRPVHAIRPDMASPRCCVPHVRRRTARPVHHPVRPCSVRPGLGPGGRRPRRRAALGRHGSRLGRWSQSASVGFAPPCGWHAERRLRSRCRASWTPRTVSGSRRRSCGSASRGAGASA